MRVDAYRNGKRSSTGMGACHLTSRRIALPHRPHGVPVFVSMLHTLTHLSLPHSDPRLRYLVLPKFVDDDTVNALLTRSKELLDEFDADNHPMVRSPPLIVPSSLPFDSLRHHPLCRLPISPFLPCHH